MKKLRKARRWFSLLFVLVLLSTFFAGAAGGQQPPPAAPTNLTAVAETGTQVRLTWQDNANNELGFKIERGTDTNNYIEIATVGNNITLFSDIFNFVPATTYYYRVRAFNNGGFSDYAEASVITPGVAPTAPTNLTAALISGTQVRLTWQDNANDEDGFIVERRTGSDVNFSLVATLGPNITMYDNIGLQPNTTYTYRVRAFKIGADHSTPSNEVTVITGIPAAPTALTYTFVSTNEIRLSWADNANNESGFKIERQTGAGSFTEVGTVGANVTTFANTGLANNTQYTYRVRAYNDAGESNPSNQITLRTGVPAAPTELSAVRASSSQINLTWTDNANNETGFKIERRTGTGSFTEVGTVGANVTSYSNTGLANNTQYTYRVRAYNDAGDSAYSNEATALTGSLPEAPANLAASALDQNRILLTWEDKANNESGFQIERRTGTGSFTQIATVTANTTSYTDTGLAMGTEYTYRVRAYNAVGNSAHSNETRATTHGVPAAPANLVATPLSGEQLLLSWSDHSQDENGFYIERRTGTGSFTQIAAVPANTTTYMDNGVAPETRYTYRVRAYNVFGNSPYSNEAAATTPQRTRTEIRLRVGQISYQVDGRTMVMDAPPIMLEGRTLLPIRYVAEAIGARVEWNERELKITITQANNRIELWVNSNTARVNGVSRAIDPDNARVMPVIVPPGRTMMPLRFISEALGCQVDWNSQTREITVIR